MRCFSPAVKWPFGVVLTTMHGRNAAGVVTALRSRGLAEFEIAASLALVVAQRLVRRLCLHCRQAEPPSERKRRWLDGLGEAAPASVWHATGCAQCHHTGNGARL